MSVTQTYAHTHTLTVLYMVNSFFPNGSSSAGVAAREKKCLGFTSRKKSLNRKPTKSRLPRIYIGREGLIQLVL